MDDEKPYSPPGRWFYAALGVLSAYVFQDFFTHNLLYDASEAIIVTLQRDNSHAALVLMNIASIGCNVAMAVGLAALFVWHPNRARVMSFTAAFIVVAYLTNFLKMLYNNPRPYMSFEDVEALECATEYGNPSGHAFTNTFFFAVYPWMWLPRVYTLLEGGSGSAYKVRWVRVAVTACVGAWVVWIALSRMYLGVHSLNQVILGIVYGLIASMAFVRVGAHWLDKFFANAVYLDRTARLRWLLLATGVALVTLAVTQGTYLALASARPLSQVPQCDYIDRVIETCASKKTVYTRNLLYEKCFSHSGIIGMAIGIALTAIAAGGDSSAYVRGAYAQSYAALRVKDKLLRVLAQAAAVIVTYGPMYLIFKFVPAVKESDGLVEVRFYVQYVLNGLLTGFGIVYVMPLFLACLKVDINGDYMRRLRVQARGSDSQGAQEHYHSNDVEINESAVVYVPPPILRLTNDSKEAVYSSSNQHSQYQPYSNSQQLLAPPNNESSQSINTDENNSTHSNLSNRK